MADVPELVIAEGGSTPEFMAAYGETMAEWGFVEHALCSVFLMLLGLTDPARVGAAGAAFFASAGFRDKVNAVDAVIGALVAAHRESDPSGPGAAKLEAEWTSLTNAINRTVKHRNELAHLHFYQNGKGEPFGHKGIHLLARLPVEWAQRKEQVVTLKRLRDYAQGFRGLARRIEGFRDGCPSWPSSP